MIEIFVKRYYHSIEGDLSYVERDSNHNVIQPQCLLDLPIRSGQRDTLDDFETGVAGCPVGEHLLWVGRRYIQQYNDLDATGGEIARFYPISSSITDYTVISKNGRRRKHIGLHDENDYPGSLGCIVVVNNSDWRQLCKKLDRLTDAGVLHIKLTVFRGVKR